MTTRATFATFTLVVGLLPAALLAACYTGPNASDTRSPTGSDTDETDPETDEGEAAAGGLPCEVDALLQKRCAGCHGSPLKAPVALMTYEDLTLATDEGTTMAEESIARMKSEEEPMPPSGARVTDQELAAFETWVADGLPRTTCERAAPADAGKPKGGAKTDAQADAQADAKTDAAPITPVCTSGTTWTSTAKGTTMNPGRACITCHTAQSNDGPILQIGGTVYPTMHEPDLCYGVNGSTQATKIVITDADGKNRTLTVGPTGNFALSTAAAPLKTPYRAKVVSGTRERVMNTPQTSGDCNGCHTAQGVNGAPGRIALP